MIVEVFMEIGLIDGVETVEQPGVLYSPFGVGFKRLAQKLLLGEAGVKDFAFEDVQVGIGGSCLEFALEGADLGLLLGVFMLEGLGVV